MISFKEIRDEYKVDDLFPTSAALPTPKNQYFSLTRYLMDQQSDIIEDEELTLYLLRLRRFSYEKLISYEIIKEKRRVKGIVSDLSNEFTLLKAAELIAIHILIEIRFYLQEKKFNSNIHDVVKEAINDVLSKSGIVESKIDAITEQKISKFVNDLTERTKEEFDKNKNP